MTAADRKARQAARRAERWDSDEPVGSQFTAEGFTDVVLDSGAKLAMDGRGAWRDNVLVEHRWRSVKYEHVYKYAYASVSDPRSKIAGDLDWYNWYNNGRAHAAIEDQTPDEAYWSGLPQRKAAACNARGASKCCFAEGQRKGKAFPLAPLAGWSVGKSQPYGL